MEQINVLIDEETERPTQIIRTETVDQGADPFIEAERRIRGWD